MSRTYADRKQRDDLRLRKVAEDIADELRQRADGTCIRVPGKIKVTGWSNADGWWCQIGTLGPHQPKMEVWLDRFTKHKNRKFWACIVQNDQRRLAAVVRRVGEFVPVRTITRTDIAADSREFVLDRRLPSGEFNQPVLEKYGTQNYFGIYDQTRPNGLARAFVLEAAEFFVAIARTMPKSTAHDTAIERAYPRHEPKLVRMHLARDRSAILSLACKQRDKYRCCGCGLRFEEKYGALGAEFAESHHRVALSMLKDGVLTKLEDLVTVCANCHRMLHRMAGKRNDIETLKKLVRLNRRRRARSQQR